MERWIRSALALLAALALVAQAQPEGKKGDKARAGGGDRGNMAQADQNGDGQVDEAEAEQFAQTRLDHIKQGLETLVKKFDANGDGTLDADEQAKMKNEVAERGGRDVNGMLKRFDKDGDFKLSEAEEAEAVKGFVAQAKRGGNEGGQKAGREGQRRMEPTDPDTNGDGIVDEQEARVEAERRVEMARKQLEMFKQRQAQNPDVKMPGFMALVDPNQDGELSGEEANAIIERVMAEFEQRNELVLKIFDDNKDGLLDAGELVAAKKAFEYQKETQRLTMERFGMGGGQRGQRGDQGGQRGQRGDQGGQRAQRGDKER